jgi:hypothetical protein
LLGCEDGSLLPSSSGRWIETATYGTHDRLADALWNE